MIFEDILTFLAFTVMLIAPIYVFVIYITPWMPHISSTAVVFSGFGVLGLSVLYKTLFGA